MRKTVLVAVLAALGFAVVVSAEEAATAVVQTPAVKVEAPAVKAEMPAAKAQVCYVCTMCKVASTHAGKCPKCGMEMTAMHVLAMKDGKMSCCSCGADCKCTMENADAKKCSCGKDIVTTTAPAAPADK